MPEIQKYHYITAKKQCQHYSFELRRLYYDVVKVVGELGSKGPFLRQTHLRMYNDLYTGPIVNAYNGRFPSDGVTLPHPPHLIREISDEINAMISVFPGIVRLQDSLLKDSCAMGALQSKFRMPHSVRDFVLELLGIQEIFHDSVRTESLKHVGLVEYWSDVGIEGKIWNDSPVLLVVRQLERLKEVLKSLDAFILRYEKAKYAD